MKSKRLIRPFAAAAFCIALGGLPAASVAKKGDGGKKAAAVEEGKKKPASSGKAAASGKPAAGAKDAAKKLRGEWKVADLKMTRDAVDEAAFPADIKRAAAQAVDWFLGQQEALLSEVQRDPAAEGKARTARAKLEKGFNQKMSVVYDDPKLMTELGRQLKAMEKEMEEMCDSADRMFARLDGLGVTPEQKRKLRPVIQEANQKLRKAVDKSATRSTKDGETREEVVAIHKNARAKLRQQLTKEQRDNLTKKLADE